MAQEAEKKTPEKISFKDTLNLPRTDFSMRPQAAIDDPKMIERWAQEKLYAATFELNKGAQTFILHDGPPYANGHLHLGHGYNKVLKDIITKSQRMSGKHVPVTPGWDCHGLPIELKVTQENPGLAPEQLKKKCREYATHWVNIQRDEFKRLGVLMDWDNPYLTMNKEYESAIVRAFGQFFSKGYIEKKNKTVPWCMSCQTVLATAEIEYQDRKDPSIYVLFPLEKETVAKSLPELSGKQVSLLVWTTTPWTLPLNRAVCLKPKAEYQVLEVNDQLVVLGKELVDRVTQMMGVEKKVVATIPAEKFVGGRVQHPFVQKLVVPILLESFVSLEDGTACVHSAPGCGPEDYEIGVRNNIEIFSPLSPDGKYTKGIAPTELEGMAISDALGWVIKTLSDNNRLMFKQSIKHSYPHCWRCRGGLMFRATKQWFLNLSKDNLRQRALDAIEKITFVPERSINFLKATVASRLEWCISRQRAWGVPIPALVCDGCGYAHTDEQLISKVADGVAEQGVEFWDTVAITDLVPAGFACQNCAKSDWTKERDILDVWFDSGVSHYAVLQQRSELTYPADMYLEGVDQHRGWFQSSLLTSMVLEPEAAMRSIVTHGFTVDAKGRKMSKSLGNVVAPDEIIKKLGTDGLRLWASAINIEGDAVVSDVLVRNVAEVYRKVRNTCRFLLSNLYDFDIDKDVVEFNQLRAVDRYALYQLLNLDHEIRSAYQQAEFTAVFHGLGDYCSTKLSSFYLDVIKDRLYTDYPTSHERRSAQTVCWYILDTLTRLMAPVLSFTAEAVSDHYQKDKKESIHLQSFADNQPLLERFAQQLMPESPVLEGVRAGGRLELKPQRFFEKVSAFADYEKRWEVIGAIRSAILKAIEGLREKGEIRHSLEARVRVLINKKVFDMAALDALKKEVEATGQTVSEFLKELLIVSQVEYEEYDPDDDEQELDEDELEELEEQEKADLDGLLLHVGSAMGDKCPRCWQWEATDHELRLCTRCQQVVEKLRQNK